MNYNLFPSKSWYEMDKEEQDFYRNMSEEQISTLTNHLISKKYNLKKSRFEKTKTFKKRVKAVKDNIEEITNVNMEKAYNTIYGTPIIESIDYDADNELFYGLLKSSKGNLSEKIAINIPLNISCQITLHHTI